MDAPTASVLVAALAVVGTIANGVINAIVLQRTGQVHALVNGLSHEKEQLAVHAAAAEGKLEGIAREQARLSVPAELVKPADPTVT